MDSIQYIPRGRGWKGWWLNLVASVLLQIVRQRCGISAVGEGKCAKSKRRPSLKMTRMKDRYHYINTKCARDRYLTQRANKEQERSREKDDKDVKAAEANW